MQVKWLHRTTTDELFIEKTFAPGEDKSLSKFSWKNVRSFVSDRRKSKNASFAKINEKSLGGSKLNVDRETGEKLKWIFWNSVSCWKPKLIINCFHNLEELRALW